MPEISVILPVYNGEKYITQSIDSIFNQSFTDWELIIVNDCSSDKSRNIIEEYQKKDDRIKIINNSMNQGLPESLNIGFREATGNYFTWTSDDNMYEENAFIEMYRYMENNIDTSMVVANMLLIDEEGKYVDKHMKYDRQLMGLGNRVGGCFLYRSNLVAQLGEYNPKYNLVEDYEYWLRILFSGRIIGHIDMELYKYRMHKDSLTMTKKEDVGKKTNELRINYLDDFLNLLNGRDDLIYKFYIELYENQILNQRQLDILKSYSILIERELDYREDMPTIIYGCGKFGKRLSRILDNVIYFADYDLKKKGLIINDIEVISQDEMISIQEDYQVVIALNEIILVDAIDDLIKKGLKKYCSIKRVLMAKNVKYEDFILSL